MKNNSLFKFNAERYFYLKSKRASLIKEKNNQQLPKSERSELSNYRRQYFYYLCWKRRLSFLNLIQKFIQDELDSADFYLEFHFLWRDNQKLLGSPSLEILKKVRIDPQSASFSTLIDNIAVSVDVYEMAPDDDISVDIRLKNAVSNEYAIFLESDSAIDVEMELDPFLLKSLSIVKYQDTYVLQETMFFFTLLTSVCYTFLNPTLFNLIWK